MSQLPPAIAIRLEGKNSFNVAMTVIEELCAENSGLQGGGGERRSSRREGEAGSGEQASPGRACAAFCMLPRRRSTLVGLYGDVRDDSPLICVTVALNNANQSQDFHQRHIRDVTRDSHLVSH
jgi:hypothetical protein